MLSCISALLLAVGPGPAPPTHSYTRIASARPHGAGGAFVVEEGCRSVDACIAKCDALAVSSGPCAGFALVDVDGIFLCEYYHTKDGLGPPDPPEPSLLAFYEQGPAGPPPAPSPPLPPPPPPPTPPPPPPRAPERFVATLWTDVGGSGGGSGPSPIVLNVTRAAAPVGVDHFHELVRVGFYNDSAFLRVAPGFVVQWGVSGNATLNEAYGHTPIADDPVRMSNVRGTLALANGGYANSRATVLYINFGNNSHLDAQGMAPFATLDAQSMATALAIHNPTPNSSAGVPEKAYADNGNAWIRKTYPGINFITGAVLSSA